VLRPTADDLSTRPIIERNPWGAGEPFPRSETVFRPGILPTTEPGAVGYEEMTQWSPFGTFYPAPQFDGWDPLSQVKHGVMHVPQADLYDASPNPWPNNGQFDHPNKVALEAIPMLAQRGGIPRETSAHPGFMQPTAKGDPSSLFHAPPVFSVQQRPIPAVGL